MLKKVICVLIVMGLIISNFSIVNADDIDETTEENELLEVVNQTTDEPVLNARIAVVIDRKSGNVIYGKDENKRSAMASTTNVMET